MDTLNRNQLLELIDEKFFNNVLEAITPEDARTVTKAIVNATATLLDDLGKKADLIDGKVPTNQLPIPTSQLGTIPAWSSGETYSIGRQVTYQDRIWQSRINGNINIPPNEGAIWKEVSPTHLQNTDSQLMLPDGTPLTAQYIVDNLGGKPVYKTLVTIEAATDAVTVDPAGLVPAEFDLAEIVYVREGGVACTVSIPGYESFVIPAATAKTFSVKILRFADPVTEESLYYCFTDLNNYLHKTNDKGTLAQILAGTTPEKYVDTVLLNSYLRRFQRIGQGQTMDPFSPVNQLFGQDIPGNATVYPATFFFLHNPTENCVKSKFMYVGPNDNSGGATETHGDAGGNVFMYALVYDDATDVAYERVYLNGTELIPSDIEEIEGLEYWKISLKVGSTYLINLTRNHSNATGYFDLHVFQMGGAPGPGESSDKLSKTTDDTAAGMITFLQTIVSNTGGGAVIEQAAWEDLTNEETYRKIALYLVNRAAKEISLGVDVADDLASIFFADPDGGNNSGITFGVAGTINANNYKGVNMYYSRGGVSSGSLRLYLRDSLSFLNAYFSRASSQKIGSIPNNEVLLNIVSGVVTLDLGAFTGGRGSLAISQNISFAITNQEDSHEYIISATTDSTTRTITLPSNSLWCGNVATLSLAAGSRFNIAVRARNVSGTWNYEWIINKFN